MDNDIEIKIERLQSMVDVMSASVGEIEVKLADLWSRPRMPYTQNASPGDYLELDSDKIPIWVTP
jgi:hypothetical protein